MCWFHLELTSLKFNMDLFKCSNEIGNSGCSSSKSKMTSEVLPQTGPLLRPQAVIVWLICMYASTHGWEWPGERDLQFLLWAVRWFKCILARLPWYPGWCNQIFFGSILGFRVFGIWIPPAWILFIWISEALFIYFLTQTYCDIKLENT